MAISILLISFSVFIFGTEHTQILTSNLEYIVPIGNYRTDYTKFNNKIIGKYGDYRGSNVPGHKHSGIDIKGDFNDPVYSIGKGTVTHIFRSFPHKTIYIQHRDGKGMPFYSVYIHVEGIKVKVGDRVTKNIIIARIFNKEELMSSYFGTPPHLHFEIRHSIDDKGEASFKSMSIDELNQYCIDPLIFFNNTLRNQ
jgi:murein DD-endopeptidase MepM/ murein hydrolase activator NlpD